MVHVSTVPSGKKCGCFCPECRGPLIAYQGRRKAHHFGHFSAAVCNPPRALETMLHKLAKQIIEERREVFLPPVVAYHGQAPHELSKGGFFWPESVVLEEAMSDMRPDIVARRGEKVLFIEIAVRHKVNAEKLARIKARRQPTIEINLAKWRYETDEAVLVNAIIQDAPREWLYNATAARQEAAWIAEQNERDRKRRERASELADAILLNLQKPVTRKAPTGSLFVHCAAAIDEAGMTDEVGIDVAGSAAFGVTNKLWQALVLHMLFRNTGVAVHEIRFDDDEAPLLTSPAAAAYRDTAADWELIERTTAGHVREPRTVIRAYLDHLCQRGVAIRYGAGHYEATWDAKQRAERAREAKQAQRDRLTALRSVFDELSEAVGAPAMPFENWLDTRHAGIVAAPRELVASGGSNWQRLLNRMRDIQKLVEPNSSVVEGGLLGFPAEEYLAARIADADKRHREAEQRRAARIAAEKAKQTQRAADLLARFRAEVPDAAEAGIDLLRTPLSALGGDSIESRQGWLSSAESESVWSIVDRYKEAAERFRAKEAASRAEIEKWREKLYQYAESIMGPEYAKVILRSRYPATYDLTLNEYCSDANTYKNSLEIIRRIKKSRR